MDLWIRSQDGEKLIPINDEINICCGYIACEFTANIEYKGKVLATYKSKKRVLEVLDEIQSRIIQNECLKTMMPKVSNIKGEEEKFGELFKEMVYQMPDE